MPDKKITDLVDGAPLQPTDEFVVARAGDNFKIDGSEVVAAVTKHDVTISGNTAGALAAISSGTWTLAGGNNITLSQAGNAVTISGAAAGGAQTAISGISASDTLYTSGTVRFTGSQAVTVRSGTGQLVVIDAPAQSVQPETQTFIAGISASDTLYTSGNVRITGVGGGVTVSSNTGQRVDISVAAPVAQTEQTQNVVDLTLSGNTAGALALISSGTATLAGGNNITLSQAGNAITISGPNVGGAQTGISGLANSETTYTSGSVTLSALGAVTIRSTTGQHFQISVNSQSVQPETQTFIAGISASDTLYTSGNVRFTGVGGGVTVSSNTGQRVDISVAAQSVQPETQTFVGGIGNSQTTYTSGTVNLSVVAGNLTIRSTTGQAFQFSMSQTVQPETQTAISGIANSQTTYTSGTVSLSELGAITIRSTTGNQYQFSVNAQTAQTGISGIANSQTTYTSGTVSLSELGAITIRSTTGNQYQLSVNSQTVQTQGVLSVGVSTGGNTAGNTTVNTGSRFVIVGSNGITASQGTAAGATTVTLSVAAQSVQPETQTFVSGVAASNTTYTSGVLTITGVGGGVTVSSNTGQRVDISVAAPVAATNLSVGASNIGNTSGNTTVNTGSRLVFAGGNNITISQGTAAGATTLTISAPNLGAGAMSAGASNLGNTAGSTGITGTQLVLVGSDNITLSQSTGANGGTVSIIGGGGGGFSGGVSTGGNTAGATGITGTQNVFVGVSPMSLSQTTGANGGTISILAPATSSLSATGGIQISTNGSTISIGDGMNTLDYWDNLVLGASTTFQLSDAALHIYPMNPANAVFPGYMSVSSVFFDMSGTVSTAAAFTRSMSLGFYTMVNSTQLSLLYSASTSWGTNAGNMNVNDSMGGRRWVTLQSSQFNAAPNFSNVDYFMALWARSSGGTQTFNFLGQHLPFHTGIRSGFMSAASATNTTLGHYPFLGNYSVSFTTEMPDSIAASVVNKSNATAISIPRIIFNNIGTNIV